MTSPSTPEHELLSWAADEVHAEARWMKEQELRGRPEPDPVSRLLMVEKIIRDRASTEPAPVTILAPPPDRDRLVALLDRHAVIGYSPGNCVCACDRTWRPHDEYRTHLADVIRGEWTEQGNG